MGWRLNDPKTKIINWSINFRGFVGCVFCRTAQTLSHRGIPGLNLFYYKMISPFFFEQDMRTCGWTLAVRIPEMTRLKTFRRSGWTWLDWVFWLLRLCPGASVRLKKVRKTKITLHTMLHSEFLIQKYNGNHMTTTCRLIYKPSQSSHFFTQVCKQVCWQA